MSNWRTRVIVFAFAVIILGGLVIFRDSLPGSIGKPASDGFEKAQKLMQQLQSNALTGASVSTEQAAFLKQQRDASVERVSLLSTLIDADVDRARSALRRLAVPPSEQQAIINEFALVSPRSYYNNHVAEVL